MAVHTWACAVTEWWQNPKRGDGPTPPPCTCGLEPPRSTK